MPAGATGITGLEPSVLSLAVWTVPAVTVRLEKEVPLLPSTRVPGPIFVKLPEPVMAPFAVSASDANSISIVAPFEVTRIGFVVVAFDPP